MERAGKIKNTKEESCLHCCAIIPPGEGFRVYVLHHRNDPFEETHAVGYACILCKHNYEDSVRDFAFEY